MLDWINLFRRTSAVALAVCTASTGYSAEDEAGYGFEEIVVTAQKREQSLREVPISITAFSEEQIDAYRIDEIRDYMELTPNVGFYTTGDTIDNTIAIRGVTNIGGNVNSMAVYVDEFNVTPGPASSTYEQDLLDVERIEVLRGPQGTLFGRNLIGGAINLTTRKPHDELEAEITAEYGSYDAWLLKTSVNAPVVPGRVAVRATGYWREDGGFIDDIGPAGNTNDHESKGGRLAARFMPTDTLTIDLTAARSEYEQGLNNFVPSGQLLDVLTQLGFTEAIDEGQGFYPVNRDTVATNRLSSSSNDTTILTSRIEWDLGGYSLISVSGYLDNEASLQGDGDLTTFDYYFDDGAETLETYSTELRAQSNGTGAWNWIIGASYSHDRTRNSFLRVLTPDFMGLFGVDDSRRIIDNLERASADSYAVFGDLTWQSDSGRLVVSAGARFTHDEITDFLFDNSDNLFTGVPLGNQSEGTQEFDDVSPRVAVMYSLTDEVNVYGTISKGFKSGGFNFGAERLEGLPDRFDKETAWNYEVGLKGLFADRRLSTNVAVFWMDWDEIQVDGFFIDEGFNRVQFIQNAATATSRGIEFETVARPVDALDLQLNVGYNDATFDSFPEAFDTFGEQFDAGGHRLPLAPQWTLGGAVQYNFLFSTGFEGFIRGEFAYRDTMFNDPENDRMSIGQYVPSYDTWNLRVGFENERFRVVGFVENLFDEDYYVGARQTEFLSGKAVVVEPRRAGIRLTAKFD